MLTTTRLLAAILMTVLLTACSGSGGGDAASGEGHDGASASQDAPAGELATTSDVSGLSAGSSEESRDTDAASETGASSTAPTAPRPRAMIKKGTVSLTSDDVRTARQDVQRVLDRQDGSISEEQTESDDDGELSYARLVVRVPVDSFDATMSALEEIADFRSSDRGSQDVSTEVIDNDVRVRAQQASRRRVEQLLARADSLKEIIWIESQLTQRQAELDSLKSRQAWLSDQTALATITVDIAATPEAEKPEKKDGDGFLAGLAGGWKALSSTANALATVVGALLPFAVVGVLIGLPLWVVVRRSRARRRTVTAGEA